MRVNLEDDVILIFLRINDGDLSLPERVAYAYRIAQAGTGGLTAFDPNKFVLDVSSFAPTAGGPKGFWTIGLDAGNPDAIDLFYTTPTPEPAGLGLMLLAIARLLRRPRRRA